jgi:hypothetical protein
MSCYEIYSFNVILTAIIIIRTIFDVDVESRITFARKCRKGQINLFYRRMYIRVKQCAKHPEQSMVVSRKSADKFNYKSAIPSEN